ASRNPVRVGGTDLHFLQSRYGIPLQRAASAGASPSSQPLVQEDDNKFHFTLNLPVFRSIDFPLYVQQKTHCTWAPLSQRRLTVSVRRWGTAAPTCRTVTVLMKRITSWDSKSGLDLECDMASRRTGSFCE